MYISGLAALGILFVVLKLAGAIDTPWVFVLSPFWFGPVFVLVVYLYASIFHRDEGD